METKKKEIQKNLLQGQMTAMTPATERNYLCNYDPFPYFLFKYTDTRPLLCLDFALVWFCGVGFFYFRKTGYQFLNDI